MTDLLGSEEDFDASNSLRYSLALKFPSLVSVVAESNLLEGLTGFDLEFDFDCTEKESFIVGTEMGSDDNDFDNKR